MLKYLLLMKLQFSKGLLLSITACLLDNPSLPHPVTGYIVIKCNFLFYELKSLEEWIFQVKSYVSPQ